MDIIYTKEDCLKWKLNKLINPKTNRKIEEGKGIYNKILNQCSNKSKSKSPIIKEKEKDKYTKEDCLKWKLNKLINPKTNRKIEEGKGIYNKILNQCSNKSKSKSPIIKEKEKDKYTKEDCLKWKLNKLINPKTNRKIEEGKGIYNKILNQCSHDKTALPIQNKPKSKQKEAVIYILKKSILDNLDKNQVIVDPAGLSYMQTKFKGAQGASGIIYEILNKDKPNKEVIDHYLQFKTTEDLYKNNKKNISVAYYTSYNNNTINIIHTVGPDFRTDNYLKKIITNDDLTELYKLYYKIYDDVYKQFIIHYNNNNNLELRLLVVSTAIFINYNEEYKLKILTVFIKVYLELNKLYNIKPIIYLVNNIDYNIIVSIAKKIII